MPQPAFGAGIWHFATYVDRYATDGYGEPVSLPEMIDRAGAVGDLSYVDLNYPFVDRGLTLDEVKAALERNNLKVIGITPEIYTRVFAKGAFTNPDPGVRERAHELITDAAGVVRELGASYVKLWPGQDGWDYPFQVDHHALWKNSLDGVGRLAEENPDLRFVIEYKPREPRVKMSFDSVARTLLGIESRPAPGGDWKPDLHGPGAGQEAVGRSPGRRLLGGSDALGAAGLARAAAEGRPDRALAKSRQPQLGAAFALPRRPAQRDRRAGAQGAEENSRRALPERGGVRRGDEEDPPAPRAGHHRAGSLGPVDPRLSPGEGIGRPRAGDDDAGQADRRRADRQDAEDSVHPSDRAGLRAHRGARSGGVRAQLRRGDHRPRAACGLVPPVLLKAKGAQKFIATLDEATPTRIRDPRLGQPLGNDTVNATRTSFGVTFHGATEPRIEASLLQEVEAGSGEELNEDYLTRPYGPLAGRFALLAAAVFVAAIGLGFLGMMLWARFL